MRRGVLLIGVLVATVLCVGCDEAPPEGDGAALAEGEDCSAEDECEMVSEEDILLADRCTLCHGSERYENVDYTVAEWLEVLDEMIARGAVLSSEEKAVLTQLLVK